MAEEEEVQEGGKKKLIFIIVGVVVLAGVGGFLFLGGGGDAEAAEMIEEPEILEGEVLDVGALTIVLADNNEDGSLRYARVGLALVLNAEADSSAIAGKVSLMQDAAISVFSDMTTEELLGADGAAEARQRLTNAAQEIYDEGEVIRVVLTEMLLQ